MNKLIMLAALAGGLTVFGFSDAARAHYSSTGAGYGYSRSDGVYGTNDRGYRGYRPCYNDQFGGAGMGSHVALTESGSSSRVRTFFAKICHPWKSSTR